MKKLFICAVIIATMLIMAISCDNKQETEDLGDNGDSGNSGSDIVEKDDDEFITAGSSEDEGGRNGAESDYGDSGDDAAEDTGSADGAEREIVEADIYKVDGDILWVLNSYRGLAGIDISDPENLSITGRAAFRGSPYEMYMQDNKAYVLINNAKNPTGDDDKGRYENKITSSVMIIDVSDRSDLVIEEQFFVDGRIVDSRQVGDIIYLVSSRQRYYYYGCDGSEERGKNETTLISLNVSNPNDIEEVDRISIEGNGHSVYVSQKSVYIADYNYETYREDRESGKEEIFPVHRFDISDPDGSVKQESTFKTGVFASDRWKMHEKEDVFFLIGGTTPWGGEINAIESYDVSDPDNVVKLDGFVFMENHRLHATRFEGDKAYAVTFQQVDPLHILSIEDPENLEELGQLDEIPGWSTHIEVRDGYLLAMGIDDTEQTAKISMYDVSDPTNPVEKGTVQLSDGSSGYSYSEAIYDWKAFKVYDELGLMLAPTRTYSYDEYRFVDKLHLVDFDKEKGLEKRGNVDSPSYVKRGIVIKDFIAAIGTTSVVVVDPKDRDNPEIISSLTVAHNISNLDLCGSDLCGIYTESDISWGNKKQLALYNPYDDSYPVIWTSEEILENHGQVRFLPHNNRGYLFTYFYGVKDYDNPDSDYSRKPGMELDIYNFSSSGNPEKLNHIELKFDEDSSSGYYNLYNSQISMTESNVAVLQETFYHSYCEKDGEPAGDTDCNSGDYYYVPRKNIFYIDVSDTQKESYDVVELDTDLRTVTYNAPLISRKNELWTTDCDVHGFEDGKGELLKCYAVSYDFSDPSSPERTNRINIPGELVGISQDGKYMYSYYQKYHYLESENKTVYKKYLFALKKDGDSVKLHKTIPLHDVYSYNEEENRYINSQFIIKNKNIFIAEKETVYRHDEDSCSYWYYLEENSLSLSVLDVEKSEISFEKTYENGVSMDNVKNGGVILGVSEHYYNGWYGYGYMDDEVSSGSSVDPGYGSYYSYSNEIEKWIYLSSEGDEKEIDIPVGTDASGYGSYYGYYYNAEKAVLFDNKVHIAGNWKGIISASVK